MKNFIARFIAIYVFFIALFVVQRLCFIAWYHDLFANTTIIDIASAIGHGLQLDMSVAGYLSALPGLMLIAASFISLDNKILKWIMLSYFGLISFIVSAIFTSDIALYEFWGFRLDTTPIFYLTTSPKDAFASVGVWYIICGFAAITVCSIATFYALKKIAFYRTPVKSYNKPATAAAMLLMTGLLFIPIRGGFTVSTMNLSVAYFSQNQKLNHAAINPAFSLMYSATHQNNFDKQYRYMDGKKADALFAQMVDRPDSDSIPQLLNNKRPDIIFIILESFSSHLMKTLGGNGIAVNLDREASEGLLFTNFYGNSFRTDRGLVSIISGYPAQPSTSIMKYAEKVENLPSIPRSLRNNGYDLAYYYGGDANFTNMYAYLVSCGFDKVISDKDFPLSQHTGKWGANDGVVFRRFINDYFKEKASKPRFRILQTSSSHEPFDVPYNKFNDKKANAFAYADSCTGDFIKRLKATELWKKSLVVLVPDHYGSSYPELGDNILAKHQIPLIMTGGALKLHGKNDTFASQIDIAATLLYAMGIKHSEFSFSKNILNPASPHFGYFTEPSLFGMVTSDNVLIFNCDANQVINDSGAHKGKNLEPAKAFLQKLYDDLAKR